MGIYGIIYSLMTPEATILHLSLLAPCEHGGLVFNLAADFRLVAQVIELKPVLKVCDKDYEYIFSSTVVVFEYEAARIFINMDKFGYLLDQ